MFECIQCLQWSKYLYFEKRPHLIFHIIAEAEHKNPTTVIEQVVNQSCLIFFQIIYHMSDMFVRLHAIK